jgi:hypothetical protein
MAKKITIKERILEIAKLKGFKLEDFCNKINMSYGNFKGKAKETPINSDTIANILTIIPDLNPTWLLTGEGPMLYGSGPPDNTIAADPMPNYTSCQLCKEKDRVIAAQEKTIALLEEQLRECKQSKAKEGEPAQPVRGPELAQLK